MALMKTIFWSLNRRTVFLQNLLNHIRFSFSGISDNSNNIFQQIFTFACLLIFDWISPNKKFVLHKYWLFQKLQKRRAKFLSPSGLPRATLSPLGRLFRPSRPVAWSLNLHRAVIGPSATLTGRWRPDIDLRRMLTGKLAVRNYFLSMPEMVWCLLACTKLQIKIIFVLIQFPTFFLHVPWMDGWLI